MHITQRLFILLTLLALFPFNSADAQTRRRERPWPEASASTEAKRAFLIERFLATLPDDKFLAAERGLAALNPEQVDQMLQHFRSQYEAYGSELRVAREHLSRAEAYRDELQRRAGGDGGSTFGKTGGALGGDAASTPGYRPVVTWLPEGASLGVGAVVSPDRRYVRINAQPFFSSVGPVQTFQFQSGGYAPGYYYAPAFGHYPLGYGYGTGYYQGIPSYRQVYRAPQPRGGGQRTQQPQPRGRDARGP